MTLLDRLKNVNIITKTNAINKQAARLLQKEHSLFNEVVKATSFFDNDTPIRVRLICIRDNITVKPVCKVCGNDVTFNSAKGMFNSYCPNTKGSSCASRDTDLQQQIKQTTFDRYGTDNVLKLDNVREQIKRTNTERYGGIAPIHNQAIKQKIKITNLKRYGSENPQQNSDVRDKTSQTNKARYGMETYAASLKDDITKDKISEYSYNREWLYEQHHDQRKTLTDIGNELGLSTSVVSKRFQQLDIPVCKVESPLTVSQEEIEFRQFIIDWVGEDNVIINDKSVISPYELDVYVPSMKLAFEFNGIFWHSELSGRRRQYHANKTKMCNVQGIRLIQVWSNEWKHKRALVMSRIKNILGHSNRMYARKCEVRSIDFTVAHNFLNLHHIQGGCSSSIQLGLFYSDVLFGVMTFGRSRFNKNYEYELLRFANASNYTIVGGASKLFTHFIKTYNPMSIISFSDRRWNTGNLYNELKFEFLRTSSPNYFYFNRNGDTNRLLSRNKFQKHKLESILEEFDPTLSEWENMKNNGYDRIWDCGNDVFVRKNYSSGISTSSNEK